MGADGGLLVLAAGFSPCRSAVTAGGSSRGMAGAGGLLPALASERFRTWLLNSLWAGTWHSSASAPSVLVALPTVSPCPAVPPRKGSRVPPQRWQRSARPFHPDRVQQAASWVLCGEGRALPACSHCRLVRAGRVPGWRGASRSAVRTPRRCRSWRHPRSLWCQPGPVGIPGDGEASRGFHTLGLLCL